MSALREQVADARRERVTVVATDDDTTLPDAYDIQRALFAGRELAGYKLGLVSPAKRAQMGQDAPVYGHVAAEMVPRGRGGIRGQPRSSQNCRNSLVNRGIAGGSAFT